MDETSSLREIPVSSETIYDGKILHVEKWTVTCPNGREALREIRREQGQKPPETERENVHIPIRVKKKDDKEVPL